MINARYVGDDFEPYDLARKRFGWLFELVPEHKASFWIAGGALRAFFAREEIKDIDVFFAKAKDFDAVSKLAKQDTDVILDNDTVLRVRYKDTVLDLVRRPFHTAVETLANFDFTVACCALSSQALYFDDNFFYDLAAKRLRINALPFPVSTLVRLQRYAHRGYHACPETMRQIALAIHTKSEQAILDESLYHSID
jgi:hypothetical protein